eukprot:721183-Pelagomonas_calceolata.AAC.4
MNQGLHQIGQTVLLSSSERHYKGVFAVQSLANDFSSKLQRHSFQTRGSKIANVLGSYVAHKQQSSPSRSSVDNNNQSMN